MSHTRALIAALALAPATLAQGLPAAAPPNARPGACYARVQVPAQYKTEYRRVLAEPGREQRRIIPAQFREEIQRVLVAPARTENRVVPAEYAWREQRVLVTPATTRIEAVPAQYETRRVEVLDRPAHTEWRPGKGALEHIDGATGEIYCMVEVPATYKWIDQQVLVRPGTWRQVPVPAVYETVRQRVLVKPERVMRVQVPARYEDRRVRKLVSPAKWVVDRIPPRYQDVPHQVLVAPARQDWREVLCESNITESRVTAVQVALARAGFSPGSADGQIGAKTWEALRRFQRSRRLPEAGLSHETLRALGLPQ